MKKSILGSLTLLFLFVVLTAELMDDNGKAGYVGAPGEVTCNTTQCHNSFTLNTGTGFLRASSTMNNWTYEPNTIYSITITVGKSGSGLFGFASEILNSSNDNAGIITVSDAVHTRIKTKLISGITRRDITHTLNGGLGADSIQFTFSWTSPDTTAGTITMYFAGNASNSNDHADGDYIYTSTQSITPAIHTSTDELISSNPLSVYPNPVLNKIAVHYSLKQNENVSVRIYSLDGKENYLLSNDARSAGENNDIFNVPENCPSGLYLLCIESPSCRAVQKISIQ